MGIQKLRHWLFFLTFLISHLGYAEVIDSLKNLLKKTHDVERKIEIHTLLAKQYQVIDLHEARSHADKAFHLSKTAITEKHLGEVYGLYGDIAVLQDSLDEAKRYYEFSLQYFLKNDDLKNATGVNSVLGNIAMTQDDLSTAMQYYLKTIQYAKASGQDDWLPSIYLNIGEIYFETGQIKEAQENFTRALEGSLKINFDLIAIEAYNNLGSTYLEMGELTTAKEYFQLAIDESKQLNANIRSGKARINLAKVFREEGNYMLAIETLYEAEEFYRIDNPNYAGPRLTLWADYYLGLGINNLLMEKRNEAHRYLNKGLQLSLKTGQLKLAAEAMHYLSIYWDNIHNADSTLYYYKLYKTYTDSLNLKENIRKLAFQKAQFKYDEHMLLEKQEREKETATNRLYLIISVSAILLLILLLALLIMFLKLSRNKVKRGEVEQIKLRTELDQRNKELTTHLMHQVQNNEFTLNISKKIKSLYANSKPENKKFINEVVRELEMDSSKGQWEEFEIRFQQVHTDFYKNLGKIYPELTPNELRICAFLKLNMNTKDIAAITFQSTNSIGVARYRLRQKFGLDKEENLTNFLTQF